jgi:serine/threonine protein kinase
MPRPALDRWRALTAHLDQVLDIPEDARDAWLEALAVEDPSMAAECSALLARQAIVERERFLETPARVDLAAPYAGQVVGAYTLLDPIGEGGMGSVWLAERSDGRFERRVAIKFVNTALASPIKKERFLREGCILGRLAYPNIAGLLDAGVTGTGRPYLVIEYVEGEPIDSYCERHGAGLEARLRLFIDVLGAVAHAHANLIVHRDIKPSNVLVTAGGRVKLLDFGIAKLLDTDGSLDASLTRDAGAMTPLYAAPEQLTGGTITTATDVYALGVLLYLVVGGQHPAGNGPHAPADLIRAILDAEPPPLADASSARGKARRLLRGDLDTIAAKALRKQPDERYASAEAMAEDLRRYLRHEPILARPDTIRYRTSKFFRRYRWPVVGTLVLLAALSLALYGANRERARAEIRFAEVRQLANRLFDIDAEVRNLPGSSRARQLIVDTSLEYLRRLSADAHGDPDLALDLGTAYLRVGRVQGVPVSPNLGQDAQAEDSLRHAERLITGVLAVQPRNRVALLRLAEIAHDRMMLAGTEASQLQFARQSAAWLDRYTNAGPLDRSPDPARSVVVVGGNVANTFALAGLADEAVALARRTIAIAKATNQPIRAGTTQLVAMRALRGAGRLEDALVIGREALALLEPAPGEQALNRRLAFVRALDLTGQILGEEGAVSLGRHDEATALFERAFAIAAGAARQDAGDYYSRLHLASAGLRLADLRRASDPDRAIAIYDEVIAAMRNVKDNAGARLNEVTGLVRSTYPLRQIGRRAEAGRRLEQAMAELRELHVYPAAQVQLTSETDEALRAAADHDADAGRVRPALERFRELLRRVEPLSSEADTSLAKATALSTLYEAVADLERRTGESARASQLETRRRALWHRWQMKLPASSFVQRQVGAAR